MGDDGSLDGASRINEEAAGWAMETAIGRNEEIHARDFSGWILVWGDTTGSDPRWGSDPFCRGN